MVSIIRLSWKSIRSSIHPPSFRSFSVLYIFNGEWVRESFNGLIGFLNVMGLWYFSAMDERDGFFSPLQLSGLSWTSCQVRPVCCCVLENTVLSTSWSWTAQNHCWECVRWLHFLSLWHSLDCPVHSLDPFSSSPPQDNWSFSFSSSCSSSFSP